MDYSVENKKNLATHADKYRGWLASEKKDGWRVTYDPRARVIRMKSGRVCTGAQAFADRLSSAAAPAVEGELYLGREYRAKVSTYCAGKPVLDEGGRALRAQLWLFDMPRSKDTFSARVAALNALVAKLGSKSGIRAVRQVRIRSGKQLRQMFNRIVRAGGEGVVVANADAKYKRGRSKDKVKIKGRPDAEARVVAHRTGPKGRMVLELQTPAGAKFRVGTGLNHKLSPRDIPRGSLVTYEYENLSQTGVPQQTRFVAKRPATDRRRQRPRRTSHRRG